MDRKKRIRKYLRAVGRRLRLSGDMKKRVLTDLESAIRSRMEAGQSEEDIYRELGTPKETAEELNRQMAEHTYRKSPWRWVCLALTVICVLLIVCNGVMGIVLAAVSFPEYGPSVGILGGSDGPTAIFVTRPVESVIFGFVMNGILAIMGICGFCALGHIRKEK